MQEDNTYLLVWTTTPWTLPANMAVSVNPEFAYAYVKVGDEILVKVSSQTASAIRFAQQ